LYFPTTTTQPTSTRSPEPSELYTNPTPSTSRGLSPTYTLSTTIEEVDLLTDIEIEHIDIDDIDLDHLE
jgi:hypothetical protein